MLFGKILTLVKEEAAEVAVAVVVPPEVFAREMKPSRDMPVVGMGDGCGFEISRYWFDRLGRPAIETITRVMSHGCATHLQVIDDGKDLIIAFGAPVVYMDTAIRGSQIGMVLYNSDLQRPQQGPQGKESGRLEQVAEKHSR